MKRKLFNMIPLLMTPLLLIIGNLVFKNKQYSFVSLGIVAIACIPFLLSFEQKENNVAKLVIIALMSALTVVGRIAFSALPGFKPVTAMVVITALYFGGEAGFMTGALGALLSNLYFGQGPWTPFQMFAWGLTGLLAGILAKHLKKHYFLLLLYGAFAGVLFSAVMDIWNTIWLDNRFNIVRFITSVSTSARFTLIYAASNVVFLAVLAKPVGKILDRVKVKFGIN